ncbi:hypothetical protein ABIE27_004060 [Paenibacillus sp. 4624]|uniref:hypothetical protein n=1 Tax=Paenibacillus sp. 4624 TaxID=3156453 RepID=UPI003D20C749
MIRISDKAQMMIENALYRVIRYGSRIKHLKMVVSPSSPLGVTKEIQTKFGPLRIESDPFVPLGKSYIIEDPWRKRRGFAWVSEYKQGKGEKS